MVSVVELVDTPDCGSDAVALGLKPRKARAPCTIAVARKIRRESKKMSDFEE